jgi:hypothetical protein
MTEGQAIETSFWLLLLALLVWTRSISRIAGSE